MGKNELPLVVENLQSILNKHSIEALKNGLNVFEEYKNSMSFDGSSGSDKSLKNNMMLVKALDDVYECFTSANLKKLGQYMKYLEEITRVPDTDDETEAKPKRNAGNSIFNKDLKLKRNIIEGIRSLYDEFDDQYVHTKRYLGSRNKHAAERKNKLREKLNKIAENGYKLRAAEVKPLISSFLKAEDLARPDKFGCVKEKMDENDKERLSAIDFPWDEFFRELSETPDAENGTNKVYTKNLAEAKSIFAKYLCPDLGKTKR